MWAVESALLSKIEGFTPGGNVERLRNRIARGATENSQLRIRLDVCHGKVERTVCVDGVCEPKRGVQSEQRGTGGTLR